MNNDHPMRFDKDRVDRHLADDRKIKAGLCPNGCGLLGPWECPGQHCETCKFTTNVLPTAKQAS
jgi:hypothetical protein